MNHIEVHFPILYLTDLSLPVSSFFIDNVILKSLQNCLILFALRTVYTIFLISQLSVRYRDHG